MVDKKPSAPRCAAIVGPYLSGKTTLMEGLLHVCGAIPRQGAVKGGNTVGDAAPEARARNMSTELSVGSAEFLGEQWTFIDCPGSIEFWPEARSALMVADVAIVVVEPDPDRVIVNGPLLQFLNSHDIPYVVFINKMDTAATRVRDILSALQGVSARPLVLRHVPIRAGEHITGYVDLVSERAYSYKPGESSALIEIPDELQDREAEARTALLEELSNYDDPLLEMLLEDTEPPKAEIYDYLSKDMSENFIAPVFIGAAEQSSGVLRLMKALRHETPDPDIAGARLIGDAAGASLATVFKSLHIPHSGKLSLARIWRGEVKDGEAIGGERIGGMYRLLGREQTKVAAAGMGEVVALGRLDTVHSGQSFSDHQVVESNWPEPMRPVYSLAMHSENRNDEVKLSTALARLVEEDPSLSIEQCDDTHQMLLWGQGDIHLQVAIEKLQSRYKVPVSTARPQVAYKETIRKSIKQHARHKKQSGGHGEFGDVQVEIKPLSRGSGFHFEDKIHGGAVPKNYIPAVETGVKEYMIAGPLGFPVVDLSVTLYDGQHHPVDSSDMAFRRAGGQAMREGLPQCGSVLLEPISKVTISAPNEFTARAQGAVTKRRGQILGFNAKENWASWDEVEAYIPQSELHDLIIDLRSLTLGIGTFEWSHDHLMELSGREADLVVQQHRESHT
ncbi:MAG: elongation factor G [Alphaproteobacteria bacterium]|nr:elongation factor G [Alphaproteobacteria bacterium]